MGGDDDDIMGRRGRSPGAERDYDADADHGSPTGKAGGGHGIAWPSYRLTQSSSDFTIQRKAAPGGTDDRPSPASLWDELVPGAPRQRAEADVHAAAAQGIATPAQPLPYLPQIQAAFGPEHDLSGVQAHVGEVAAASASAIGAQAFASGNDVAFANANPSLHTAAHEAAHVVQQRGGVQLEGGMGEAGDAYEQHADAVADAVVRGDSAAHLLGDAGSIGSSTGTAIQRMPSRPGHDMAPMDSELGRQPAPGAGDAADGEVTVEFGPIEVAPAEPAESAASAPGTAPPLGLSPEELRQLRQLVALVAGQADGDAAQAQDQASRKADGTGQAEQLDAVEVEIPISTALVADPAIDRTAAILFFERVLATHKLAGYTRFELRRIYEMSSWRTTIGGRTAGVEAFREHVRKKVEAGAKTMPYHGIGVSRALQVFAGYQEQKAQAYHDFLDRLRDESYADDAITDFGIAHANGAIDAVNGLIDTSSSLIQKVGGPALPTIPKVPYKGEFGKKHGAFMEIGVMAGLFLVGGASGLPQRGANAVFGRLGGITVGGVNVGSGLVVITQAALVGIGLEQVHKTAQQAADDVLVLKFGTVTEGDVTRDATPEEMRAAFDRVAQAIATGVVAVVAAKTGAKPPDEMSTTAAGQGAGGAGPPVPPATIHNPGKSLDAGGSEGAVAGAPAPRGREALSPEHSKLVGALSEDAVHGLSDVPGPQANHLLGVYGAPTLEKVAVPVGGKRLAAEVELVGPETAKAMAAEAAKRGKFEKLKRHADNLEAHSGEIAGASALESGSLLVDSQVMIPVQELMAGAAWADLSALEQIMVNKLRKRAGLPDLTADPLARDLDSLIGKQDLRAGNIGLGEIGPGAGVGGVELTVKRTDRVYADMLDELAKDPPVGDTAGAADRAVVADALFAKTNGSGPPTLMTGDAKIFGRLAQRYAPGKFVQRVLDGNKERFADAVARDGASGFTIQIPDRNGVLHPLEIIPLAE